MSTNFLEALEANARVPVKAVSPVSVAGQVRLKLPDIEAALAKGFTHRQILLQLSRDGIELSAAYYHRLIPKLRSELRAARALQPDRGVQVPPNESGPVATGNVAASLAEPVLTGPLTSRVQTHTNSDNLSITIAAPPVVRPRTILGGKAEGPKFKWDPKGAEKFDPNNL